MSCSVKLPVGPIPAGLGLVQLVASDGHTRVFRSEQARDAWLKRKAKK